MKVLQINAVYGYGSTGRIVEDLHNFLSSQGVESYFATPYYVPNIKGSIRIGNFLDHKFHSLCSRLFGLQGYFSYISTLLFLCKIGRLKPDVIHIHNVHSNYLNLPLLLKYVAKRDIPTVITLHDCWFFTGHCCHYTLYGCMKWRFEGCNDCVGLKESNKSWFFDFSRKKFRDKHRLFKMVRRLGVIGVSDWITSEAQQSLLGGARTIKRIHNWIDLEVFYPRDSVALRLAYGFDLADFIVLGVSQMWSKEKGFSVFIDIAHMYPNYKIVLVGSYSSRESLPTNILMIGEVDCIDELANIYSMADLFVNPSLQESFGKVTAEALSCGVPIIVNNTTANSEFIGEGCGYLVDNNNLEEYACHMDTVHRNRKQFYSNKCVEFASKFSQGRLLIEHLDLYNNLI